MRYAVFAALCITSALYLRREALSVGFVADDYAQIEMLEGHYPVPRASWDLFSFSNGSAAEGRLLIASGFYPWWADPELRIAMFRPAAGWDFALDHRWFGHDPFGYHLHSALVWCALLVACAWFFRACCARAEAYVAFGLLCACEALSQPLWWICNRAALYSTLFALLSLLAYRRYRSHAGAVLVAGLYSLAFAFGEYAYCLLGYFVAYELCGGPGPRGRVSALAAVLAPALGFGVLRSLLHAGVSHSGVYVDPLGQPLAFVRALCVRVPVLLGDLVFALRADYWTSTPPWLLGWYERGWIERDWLFDPSRWELAHVAVGLLACAAFVWLARRGWGRPELRWWTLGSAFAVLTVVPSFPSSRLLLAAWLGFAPLMAAWITAALARPGVIRAVAALVLVYQLALPIALQRMELAGAPVHGQRMREAIARADVDPDRNLILLSAFDGGTSVYLPATRRVLGRRPPLRCLVLSWVPTPYLLAREGPSAFSMRFGRATTLLRSRGEQLFRSPERALRAGEVVDVGLFRATILELRDGLPVHVRFDFDQPLDSPSLQFMVPADDGFRSYQLPPLGASAAVPAPVVPLAP